MFEKVEVTPLNKRPLFLFFFSLGKPLLCGSVHSAIWGPTRGLHLPPRVSPGKTQLEACLSFYCKRSDMMAKIDRLTEPPTGGAWKDSTVCAGRAGRGCNGVREGFPALLKGDDPPLHPSFSEKSPSPCRLESSLVRKNASDSFWVPGFRMFLFFL